MILIFGGAYQGKLPYALERFGVADSDVYRCGDSDTAAPGGKKIVYEIDKWILAMLKAGIDAEAAVGLFVEGNKDAIVICNDITCGVVPADPVLRQWRDTVGRALALITGNSDEVIRLFCGIPTRLK